MFLNLIKQVPEFQIGWPFTKTYVPNILNELLIMG
jgi:hypothetical protein